jgi:hypothetical protein
LRLPTSIVSAPFTALAVNAGSKLILIDAGIDAAA